MYVDFWYSKLYKAYFGEAVDNFLNDVIKESEYCSKVIETEFNKPLIIIKEDHEDFKNSTKCWICKKAYEEDEVDFWEAYWLNVANLKVNL